MKILSLSLLVSACSPTDEDVFSSSTHAVKSPCPAWKNPEIASPSPDSGAIFTVPEGLTLLGSDGKPASDFDCSKKTVVFFHGWVTQKNEVPRFRNPESWTRDYNIFIYRWHQKSFDSSPIPLKAISNAGIEHERAREDFARLWNALGTHGLRREIRFVGYSFGALPALNIAAEFFPLTEGAPRRVDLLDPALLGYDFKDVAKLIDISATYTPTLQKNIRKLNASGSKVVAFSSAVADLTASRLQGLIHVQQMNFWWMNGIPALRHTAITDYYFSSIVRPAPLVYTQNKRYEAFSASTDTQLIPEEKLFFVQEDSGLSTVDIGDDIYSLRFVSKSD